MDFTYILAVKLPLNFEKEKNMKKNKKSTNFKFS